MRNPRLRKVKKYLIRAQYELEENEDIDAAIFLIEDAIVTMTQLGITRSVSPFPQDLAQDYIIPSRSKKKKKTKKKRTLSGWNKFVQKNSKKKMYQYANGKIKLKKLGIAWRKTAEYKRLKKRR